MADAPKTEPAAPVAPVTETPAAPAAKESASTTLIKAAEHVVVESVTAIAKDLGTKSAADLKVIEQGLSKEVANETKDGLPSLSEIGEAIVDGVEVVAEEVVEGAEIAIDAVKAHPELIAEGALAAAIGVASLVQPELMVGSVAIIGKMAADSAKKTASDIAIQASTHVVNEIGKDITEDLANDAKVEATATNTEIVQQETKVDEEKGTIVKTETKTASQKMKVVATGIAKSAPEGSETITETSDGGKDVKIVVPAPAVTEKSGEKKSDAEKEPTSEKPAAEGTAKEATTNGKEDTSIVVTGGDGDKKVSVKISEDGTITIGTDATSKTKKVTEEAIEPKDKTPENDEKEIERDIKKEDSSSQATKEPTSESPPKVEEVVNKELSSPDEAKEVAPEVKKVSNKPEKEVKNGPSKEKSKATTETSAADEPKRPEISTPAPSQENGETKSASNSKELPQEETKPAEPSTEIPKVVTVVMKAKVPASEPPTGVSPTSPQVPVPSPSNSDQILAEIHKKLANLEKQQQPQDVDSPAVTPVDKHTHASLAKLHSKLDLLLATASTQPPELTQSDLDVIHLKLDKMNTILDIDPITEPAEGIEHVHQRMDAIHEALLAKNKNKGPVRVDRVDELHKKFDTMQASLDALTSALVVKATSEATPVNTPVVPEKGKAKATDENGNGGEAAGPSTNGAGKVNGDSQSLKTGAEKKPTKHVKRSSYFGGIFG